MIFMNGYCTLIYIYTCISAFVHITNEHGQMVGNLRVHTTNLATHFPPLFTHIFHRRDISITTISSNQT